MADEADLADNLIAGLADRGIKAAQDSLIKTPSLTCDICKEPLSEFRQPFGRCVDCQGMEELRMRLGIAKTAFYEDIEEYLDDEQ